MHNAAYRALGIPYTYVAIGVPDPACVVRAVRELGVKGLSIGVPHKLAVMPLLDEIDDVARQIGAVNAVVNSNGRLHGSNADWYGAEQALLEATPLSGKRVAMLGAGGAARAIAYACKRNGAHVTVFNRTIQKAEELVTQFGLEEALPLEPSSRFNQFDILINATSVGFFDESSSPISVEQVPEERTVFEAVFYPVSTVFYRAAERRRNRMIPGYRMLLHLAGRQFELYTGQKPPLDVMESTLADSLRNRRAELGYLG